jgi:hypothetical protein
MAAKDELAPWQESLQRVSGVAKRLLAQTVRSLHRSDSVRLQRYIPCSVEPVSMPARDPGCVKTCTDKKSLESYSDAPQITPRLDT